VTAHTVVIKRGLLALQVCTDREDLDEAVREVNVMEPSGVGDWMKVEAGSNCLMGDDAVVACAKFPDRRHFLVEC
jgi:hypothetical protein